MDDQPTLLVLLDDGTKTFPRDITDRVQPDPGIQISGRGRGDELSQSTSATCTLALGNADGAFTLGSTVLDTPSPIVLNRQVRVIAAVGTDAELNLLSADQATFDQAVDWTPGGSVPPSIARSTVLRHSGSGSLLITWGTGGTLPLAQTTVVGLTVGQTYTFSAWLYVPNGNADVSLFTGGAFSTVMSTKNAWRRASVTFTAAAASHLIQVWPASPTAGMQCFVDDVMVNPGSTAGVFGQSSHRFTGGVIDWPTEWPTGKDEWAVAQITAVDAMAKLARTTLRSNLLEQMLADGATVYPLTEQAPSGVGESVSVGSGWFASVSTVLDAAWPIGPAAFPPLQWHSDWSESRGLGPPDWGSAAMPGGNGSVAGFPSMAGSNFNQLDTTSLAVDPTQPITLECAFQLPAVGSGYSVSPLSLGLYLGTDSIYVSMADPAAYGVGVGLAASLSAVGGVATATAGDMSDYADGIWHWLTVVITGRDTITLYVDGALVSTATLPGGAQLGTTDLDYLVAGPASITNDGPLNVGYVGVYQAVALTPAQVERHAALLGYGLLRTDEQIERIAGYAGAPVVTQVGSQRTPIYGIDGSALVAIQAAVDAEQGQMWVDGSGILRLRARSDRAARTRSPASPDVTVAADDLDASLRFAGDTQFLLNRAEVTRSGGSTRTVEDPASIATYDGVYPTTLDLQVDTDTAAGSIAAWLVYEHSEHRGRIAGARVDLLAADTADQVAMLSGLEVSSWLRITGLPTQTPGGTTADLWVEGYDETIAGGEWSRTVNTSPNLIAGISLWQLGVSQLGVDTRLFY